MGGIRKWAKGGAEVAEAAQRGSGREVRPDRRRATYRDSMHRSYVLRTKGHRKKFKLLTVYRRAVVAPGKRSLESTEPDGEVMPMRSNVVVVWA